jgi:hypothetical protein
MCSFFSCIVTKSGDVLFDPMSDHHESIIEKYKEKYDLRDDTTDPAELKFARIEILPPNGDVFTPVESWKFTIDQSITPTWLDDYCKNAAIKCAKEFVDKAVLIGKELVEISTGRYWVKDCKIATLKGDVIIFQLLGSSQVNEMLGSSQVKEMRESSQVKEMRESSQVKEMRGSSQVNEMRGSSQVNVMWGSSQVNVMRESSQVNVMRESSQVNVMWGSSQVNVMRESSQVKEMRGSSQVNEMRGSSQVNEMRGSSQVNEMRGSSQVNEMRESSQINEMNDNSIAILRTGEHTKIMVANNQILVEVHKNIEVTA